MNCRLQFTAGDQQVHLNGVDEEKSRLECHVEQDAEFDGEEVLRWGSDNQLVHAVLPLLLPPLPYCCSCPLLILTNPILRTSFGGMLGQRRYNTRHTFALPRPPLHPAEPTPLCLTWKCCRMHTSP